MVSDEGFEENTPRHAFEIELLERLKNAGIRLNSVNHRIEPYPLKSPVEEVRLMLPKRAEFHKEIFNADFDAFIKQVQCNPDEPRHHRIQSSKTNILISYIPKQSSSMHTHLSYTQAWSKTQNPVYRALKKKAKDQFKKVTYTGPKGIILCDGGCDLFFDITRRSHHSDYNLAIS